MQKDLEELMKNLKLLVNEKNKDSSEFAEKFKSLSESLEEIRTTENVQTERIERISLDFQTEKEKRLDQREEFQKQLQLLKDALDTVRNNKDLEKISQKIQIMTEAQADAQYWINILRFLYGLSYVFSYFCRIHILRIHV